MIITLKLIGVTNNLKVDRYKKIFYVALHCIQLVVFHFSGLFHCFLWSPLILKNHGAFPTGHRCDNHNNPADFFLDVIIENEEADGPLGNLAT